MGKTKNIRTKDLYNEIDFSTARSGGPGGQHVNKVETKVILRFNVDNSAVLSDLEKEMLRTKYRKKLTKEGDLMVKSDSKKSQVRNKEIAWKKFDRLLAKAFEKPKKRKPTRPTKAAQKKRLKSKKLHGEKKKLRKSVRY